MQRELQQQAFVAWTLCQALGCTFRVLSYLTFTAVFFSYKFVVVLFFNFFGHIL